jgi:hypothetical protein
MDVPLLDVARHYGEDARRDPSLSADAGRADGMTVLRSRARMWKLSLHS